jgi:hypothetical protein
LSNALVALLENPAQAGEMGAAGQRHWMANFRYAAFRDRFLQQVLQPLKDVASGNLLHSA